MNKNLITELNRMKDLLGYKKGKVISEQLTQKQREAVNAGYPATISDEAAKKLPVGPDGKIVPKTTTPNTNDTQKNTPSAAANLGASFGNIGASEKKPAETQRTNYLTVPELMKKVGDKTGVQAFQDWLDKTYSGWHAKYKTLNGDALKGYGKFGPLTSAAWTKYKSEYLKQNPNLSQDVKKISSTTQAAANTQTPQSGATQQTAQAGASLTSGQQLANSTAPTLKQNKTPEEYYKELYDKKLIEGDPEGQGRLRYRGPELNFDQQNLLTAAMDKMGYEFLRKGNDKRLVYRKK
jgi:hypothetical protein